MNQDNLYLIGGVDGFTSQIGRLVSMMNSVRFTTLAATCASSQDDPKSPATTLP
jgi:hypothetical protein